MPISVEDPQRFVSRHWLVQPQPDGRQLRSHTGIAIVDLQPPAPAGEFRDRVTLYAPLDAREPGHVIFEAENWTISVGLASISEVDVVGNNANLFAIDSFGIDHASRINPSIEIFADVVVRGNQARLYRLNYQALLLGRWKPDPLS